MATITSIWLFITVLHTASAVDPTVSITEPVDYSGKKIVTALKNSDVALVCVVTNKVADNQVTWFYQNKNGSDINIGTHTSSRNPQKYTIITMTPTSWRLTIQNIQVYDEGPYICGVQIQTKIYKKDNRTVIVIEKPKIVDMKTSSDTSVDIGEELILTCGAIGRPTPRIKWTRLAGADLPDGGKELWANNLRISQIEPTDRGKYICRASNEAGEDERIVSVLVRFPPIIEVDQNPVYQAIGYTKALVCIIEAYPEVGPKQVTWTKMGVPFDMNSGNYEIRHIVGAFNRITSKFVIKRVTSEDYGVYICKANNAKGVREQKISLEEVSEPTPDSTGRINSSSANLMNVILLLLGIVLCGTLSIRL